MKILKYPLPLLQDRFLSALHKSILQANYSERKFKFFGKTVCFSTYKNRTHIRVFNKNAICIFAGCRLNALTPNILNNTFFLRCFSYKKQETSFYHNKKANTKNFLVNGYQITIK